MTTALVSEGRCTATRGEIGGSVVAQRTGPTMPQPGSPYGPQFGWYSTIDPAYPYTNEVIFGGISVSLT